MLKSIHAALAVTGSLQSPNRVTTSRAVFTTLQYAGGPSYGKGVCPSVCLSVTRVNCDKTNESSAEILIPHER